MTVLTLGKSASEVSVHFEGHRSGVSLLVFLTPPSTLPHISYTSAVGEGVKTFPPGMQCLGRVEVWSVLL